ncbi:hypothetical protein K439DRAFT_716040 [Ramaria rubella]|nr:hypothetical protein K439DRAFT_716040 [Ramaria rubella]
MQWSPVDDWTRPQVETIMIIFYYLTFGVCYQPNSYVPDGAVSWCQYCCRVVSFSEVADVSYSYCGATHVAIWKLEV